MRVTQLDEVVPLPAEVFGRALPPGMRLNPAAHALPLIEALVAKRAGIVPLAYDASAPYAIELSPA